MKISNLLTVLLFELLAVQVIAYREAILETRCDKHTLKAVIPIRS